MRKTILGILGFLLILGSAFFAKKVIENKTRFKPISEKVIKTVFVDTVQNTTIPIRIAANGSLKAKRKLELYTEVQGVFKAGAKLFKTGQSYKKGQTMIRMDASEYYASVQAAKSNYYNLVTSLMPDLRMDYPTVFDKWQSYLNSFDINKTTPELPKITSDKEKYFITGREVYSSYYNVKNLEKRLSKYNLNAPFDGVLTQSLVTEGTLIRPGQKLGEYISTGVYEMEVGVEKELADLLEVGKSVDLVNLTRTKKYKGIVTRINASVDQSTQTVTAFIEVKDTSLKEGIYLEADLEARQEKNAIEINRNLLQDGNTVFVVRDSILDIIPVRPVYFSEEKVILKDVENGTLLLSKPVPGAYAGMLVKVFQKNTQSTSGAKKDMISSQH